MAQRKVQLLEEFLASKYNNSKLFEDYGVRGEPSYSFEVPFSILDSKLHATIQAELAQRGRSLEPNDGIVVEWDKGSLEISYSTPDNQEVILIENLPAEEFAQEHAYDDYFDGPGQTMEVADDEALKDYLERRTRKYPRGVYGEVIAKIYQDLNNPDPVAREEFITSLGEPEF